MAWSGRFQGGSYGVGVSRLVGALIEQAMMKMGSSGPSLFAPSRWDRQFESWRRRHRCRLRVALWRARKAGVECSMTDTDERPGAKFAKLDLIGLPYQLIVGPKGLASGTVELKTRATGARENLDAAAAIARLRGFMMNTLKGTRPFAPFEWMIAFRYLRARRKTSLFRSSRFSPSRNYTRCRNTDRRHVGDEWLPQGIARQDRCINGHVFLQATDTQFTDFDEVVKEVAAVPGVRIGCADDREPGGSFHPNMAFALVRGIREADIKRLPGIAHNVKLGTLEGFDTAGGVAIGQRLAENLDLRIGDKVKILIAMVRKTPSWGYAAQ